MGCDRQAFTIENAVAAPLVIRHFSYKFLSLRNSAYPVLLTIFYN